MESPGEGVIERISRAIVHTLHQRAVGLFFVGSDVDPIESVRLEGNNRHKNRLLERRAVGDEARNFLIVVEEIHHRKGAMVASTFFCHW